MPKSTLAGAAVLLTAPILAVIAVLIQPTLSDEAAQQVAALSDHRGEMIAAISLSTVAVVMLIAGTIWLALALAPRAPRLAFAGGFLSVIGSLVVVFENGVAATAPAIAGGLDPTRATATLDSIHSSVAVSGLEPLSLIGDVGLVVLGLAVVTAGAPRSTAAAIAVGALAEGAGFATGTKGVVIAGFALLLAGLAQAVRTVVARPASRIAAKPAPAS